MDDHHRPRVKPWTILGWVLSLAALVFLGKWISELSTDVWSTLGHLKWTWLVASLVLFQVWFYLRYLAWERISSSQGYRAHRWQNLRMWTLSELMRYIPGNVWSFAARYRGATTGGAERGSSVNALVAEAGALIAGAAIVTVVSVPPSKVMLSAVIVALVAIGVLVFFPKIMARLPKREVVPPLPHVGRTIVWYVLIWIVYGFATAALWLAFPESKQMGWLTAFGINVASWLIGYLSIVTPMGLGVREVAFVSLAPATLGQAFAGLVALVTRVWFVLTEVVFLVLVLLWSQWRRDPDNTVATAPVGPDHV